MTNDQNPSGWLVIDDGTPIFFAFDEDVARDTALPGCEVVPVRLVRMDEVPLVFDPCTEIDNKPTISRREISRAVLEYGAESRCYEGEGADRLAAMGMRNGIEWAFKRLGVEITE